jgi:hypothetical protein
MIAGQVAKDGAGSGPKSFTNGPFRVAADLLEEHDDGNLRNFLRWWRTPISIKRVKLNY